MFLIDLGIFALDDFGMFYTNNGIGTPSNIELSNSIVDEIHVKQDTNAAFSTSKDAWLPSTVMIAQFIDDLHCGNVSLAGLEITSLVFKKRKAGTLQWTTFYTIPFSDEISVYEVIDRIVESGEEYYYAVCPATSTIEGDMKTASIEVEYKGTYISDKNSYYQLLYNLEMGEIVSNTPNTTVQTLSCIYPTVFYNATMNYKSGSIKCMLLSNSTYNSGGSIDVKAEKVLRNQILSFLTNKKPKILKDGGGNFMAISITGSPKIVPNNTLGQRIYDVSFEFVEVCDTNDSSALLVAGLI